MDAEVKQRNRRRKRAQRMQQAAQRESKVAPKDGDSGEEDSECTVRREKPLRPPIRRKKSKEPLVEEDIIDGFSILGFRSYDDLESVIKLAGKDVKRFLDEKANHRHESRPHITHHISAHPTPVVHGLTLTHQDPGTSDDSGRASERLTGSSVAPRDADSSRDRLSDASSRCSSGKGYICDSEGEDDKGSDASSVIFGAAPASRKHEFPGALPPSLPLSNGTSNSPVPAPTPPNLPAPSPAPAQQPPPHPISNHRTGTTTTVSAATVVSAVPSGGGVTIPCTTVPITMPQPAAAPVAHHPPAFVSTTNHGRTESPAVATSANAAVAPSGNGAAGGQYHHPTTYQPLYAPYAVHNTYSSQSPSPAAVTASTTTVPSCQQPPTTAAVTTVPAIVTSHRDAIVSRTVSPKGHSPSRERESYSSNVSSLSRSSVTPISCPPPTSVSSSLALPKSWSGANSQLSPAPPRPTPPLHSSFPSPMFAAPLPPPVTSASPLTSTIAPPPPNPNPFSAESLFQSNQADMLRRELDNRFLASQDRSLNIGPPPYLRAEMHQHQHHHTHVHQHTTSILPPPPPSASTLFPSPLFKDIPKLGTMDSPFYRQNIGLPGYPTYSSSLLHPGLTGPTPFVPPNHLPPFQPKVKPTPPPDPTKPKIVKAGKWNAMHVRIAWEVYHHQQKESKGSAVKPDLLRTPSHLFPPSVPFSRHHDISFPPSLSAHRPPTFEQPHPGIFGSTGPHIGSTISPFARYGAGYTAGSSPFGVSPLVARDLPLGPLHDPWRGLQRTVPVFPPSVNALPPTGLPPPAPWSLKPDPILEQREREERERAERERERLRREREEKERREREERQRKLEQQQQQERERERERREKERRELERRELERQQERERLLHQQRLVESTKQLAPAILRDRSPLRNGSMDPNDIRVKEEPRIKEEDRYHPYVRQHPALQHSLPHMLDRSRVLPPYPPPPTTHWPPSPAEHYYRTYDPLRYNPLMDAAMRAEEERAKLFGAYAHHAQFRPKDPGLLHLRANSGPGPPPPTHKLCATPPTDLHKKEEPR